MRVVAAVGGGVGWRRMERGCYFRRGKRVKRGQVMTKGGHGREINQWEMGYEALNLQSFNSPFFLYKSCSDSETRIPLATSSIHNPYPFFLSITKWGIFSILIYKKKKQELFIHYSAEFLFLFFIIQ